MSRFCCNSMSEAREPSEVFCQTVYFLLEGEEEWDKDTGLYLEHGDPLNFCPWCGERQIRTNV